MKQENGQGEFGQELTEVAPSRHQQKRLAYASGAPLEEDLDQQNRAISTERQRFTHSNDVYTEARVTVKHERYNRLQHRPHDTKDTSKTSKEH
ncbi:hypothetical protein IGI04_001346 [Brassica rapa subsp. trilocularis]|uniref:Uncharacterized protein n=1 Tax=Brassica rapa subsp. trilocularis TaxID=1813537 RepID=A0ABQ7NSC8_BRACM|nr:hypothetical protein IGI04_001346 [Brassica rapa subsp. trilocularis]